ncbi:major facilitator superfamily domain-containing protein [Cytidiella melzeri]|nr:major facilitator superfamily domain-containing protein [Cytidiella melzeri]
MTDDLKDARDDKHNSPGSVVYNRFVASANDTHTGPTTYRLYKKRFVGLVALIVLNMVAGMPQVWFGPIANSTASEFGLTLGQVNWFSNVLNLIFLPASIAFTLMCKRWGVRTTCYVASTFVVLSAWIRYAGTARSISTNGTLGLIMLGQLFSGIAQPAFQVIGPFYSETWFGLKSRTTVTMLIGVANPFGTGIAQLISPLPGTTRTSILLLSIISTVLAPCALLMSEAPPTPPTYAATQRNPSVASLMRALIGREPKANHTFMTIRERIDFTIITLNFGIFAGVVNSFSILTSQDFEPYGYSNDTAGFFGATLLLVGLLMAGITAPLFDRVLTHHLALTCKLFCPTLGVLWLSMIWAGQQLPILKANDEGALYAIMALIGGLSLPILPAALELAVELTRNADASAAILWSAGNLLTVLFVLVENALRADANANPPFNMHRALVFQGALTLAVSVTILGLHGKQARRQLDEQRLEETKREVAMIGAVSS